MNTRIAAVTLLVLDYDEAIAWFTTKLGFSVLEDRALTERKRWVRVGSVAPGSTELLLARAATEEERASVGRQAGGRVAFFLETDDFAATWEAMRNKGVVFRESPRVELYGTVAVFEDLSGNLWDLLQPMREES